MAVSSASATIVKGYLTLTTFLVEWYEKKDHITPFQEILAEIQNSPLKNAEID